MGIKFQDGQGPDIYSAVHEAKMLAQVASNVKLFFQSRFAKGSSVNADVENAGDVSGNKLSFMLNTPLGPVQADYDLVRIGGKLAGRYLFFSMPTDRAVGVEPKKVYGFVFSAQGYASFDEQLEQEWVISVEGAGGVQAANTLSHQLLGGLLETVEDIAPPSGL